MKISGCGMIRKSIRRGFYAKRVGKSEKPSEEEIKARLEAVKEKLARQQL